MHETRRWFFCGQHSGTGTRITMKSIKGKHYDHKNVCSMSTIT